MKLFNEYLSKLLVWSESSPKVDLYGGHLKTVTMDHAVCAHHCILLDHSNFHGNTVLLIASTPQHRSNACIHPISTRSAPSAIAPSRLALIALLKFLTHVIST